MALITRPTMNFQGWALRMIPDVISAAETMLTQFLVYHECRTKNKQNHNTCEKKNPKPRIPLQ